MYFKGKTFTTVLYVAVIITTLQSILWICLTISAILTHRCVIPTPQYESNSFVLTTIVKLWFQGDDCIVQGDVPGYPDLHQLVLMKPVDVFSWMIGYLTISVINFIMSILLLKYKTKEQLGFVLSTWCFTALFTAIMDVALTIFFILDYSEIREHVKNREDNQNIATIPEAMFIISARGFGLWLINFCLIVYFILCLKAPQNQFQGKANTRRRESRIHGYDNFTFRNATDLRVDGQVKSQEMHRGPPAETFRNREVFERTWTPPACSGGSFEAVTPFNEEEYFPEPSRKAETAPVNQGYIKQSAPCVCPGKKKDYSPKIYRDIHKNPQLMSELEEKIQTMRERRERPHEKIQTLADFSHDIRNFKQGSGEWENRKQKMKRVPPPAATKCANSGFY